MVILKLKIIKFYLKMSQGQIRDKDKPEGQTRGTTSGMYLSLRDKPENVPVSLRCL